MFENTLFSRNQTRTINIEICTVFYKEYLIVIKKEPWLTDRKTSTFWNYELNIIINNDLKNNYHLSRFFFTVVTIFHNVHYEIKTDKKLVMTLRGETLVLLKYCVFLIYPPIIVERNMEIQVFGKVRRQVYSTTRVSLSPKDKKDFHFLVIISRCYDRLTPCTRLQC